MPSSPPPPGQILVAAVKTSSPYAALPTVDDTTPPVITVLGANPYRVTQVGQLFVLLHFHMGCTRQGDKTVHFTDDHIVYACQSAKFHMNELLHPAVGSSIQ